MRKRRERFGEYHTERTQQQESKREWVRERRRKASCERAVGRGASERNIAKSADARIQNWSNERSVPIILRPSRSTTRSRSARRAKRLRGRAAVSQPTCCRTSLQAPAGCDARRQAAAALRAHYRCPRRGSLCRERSPGSSRAAPSPARPARQPSRPSDRTMASVNTMSCVR